MTSLIALILSVWGRKSSTKKLSATNGREQNKQTVLATMATMNQVQMRTEYAQRGLVTRGTVNELRARLSKDASRGLFKAI